MEAPPSPLRDLLAQPTLVDVDPKLGEIELTVAHDWRERRAVLASFGGRAAVRAAADGELALSPLSIDVEDVSVSAEEFPPNGLELSDIEASLDFDAFRTTWRDDGDGAAFTASARLTVAWTLRTEDGRSRLRPLEAGDIAVSGVLERDPAGGVRVAIQGIAPGPLLDWSGMVALSDLRFALGLVEAERD